MAQSIEEKIALVKSWFPKELTSKERYQKLMELGKKLEELADNHKHDETFVEGCQSQVHVHGDLKEGKIYFTGSSDALVTKGLLYILITVYNGEPPQTIIQSSPDFMEQLGMEGSLSQNRSNGVMQIFTQMKKIAVKYLNN